MKYISNLALSSLCFLFLSMGLTAQNLKRFYHSVSAESGMLYFINPYKVASASDKGLKPMQIDHTYLSSGDSVVLLTSIYTPSPTQIDAMSICNSDKYPVSYLYQEPKGKHWEGRLRVAIPFIVWKREMMQEQAPLYRFTTQGGLSTYTYQSKTKEWRKRRELYNQFFTILEVNPTHN